MWRRVIVFILLLIGVGYVQAQEGIVILDVVEGDIQYARLGWQSAQDLLPGTIVTTTDLMYPQDSTLLVLCSNGNTQVFFPADLRPDQPLQCPQEDSVVPVPGRRTLRVQRGAQHPTAPYVMSPRSTALRDEQLTVRWNALINVLNYTITVREANDIFWTSDLLTPQQVENENIAQWTLPEDHPLIPDIAYTIEICVTFMNTQQGCTTDPGWNTGINNAFYYVPDEALDDRIDNLSDTLQTPQLLYAQAVLLMQPIDSLSVDGMPIAYYAEAIDKLTQLQADYPDHVLATSPILSNILGELYRKVGLTRDAAQRFASILSAPDAAADIQGTEVSAVAAIGRGMTALDGNGLGFYQRGLDDYQSYMSDDEFMRTFQTLCSEIGDLCPELRQCELEAAECDIWKRE